MYPDTNLSENARQPICADSEDTMVSEGLAGQRIANFDSMDCKTLMLG